ncbi:MAG: hypothetical protein GY798_18665 [Hyphomicrobiales bacterium]|nr:hypothetical protein [Hyphomicrobiales bacterium]
MIRLLSWLGIHSRWWLAALSVAALALPALSAFLRPVLPIIVVVLLGLTVSRIDPRDIVRRLADPPHVVRLFLIVAAIVPGSVAVVFLVITTFGIGDQAAVMLLIYAAAPPISSAAALCFILGFDAILALEVTVVATLLTPILGPLAFALFGHEALQVPADTLFLRLMAIVVGGILFGIAIRRILGAAWIADNEPAFDGLVTIAMVMFIIPLFDGVGATILGRPWLALGTLGLCVVLNLGVNLGVAAIMSRRLGPTSAGAIGFMSGNRNLAIYFAAMPTDAVTALFVALYQFPMYFTPLIWSKLKRQPR